MYARIISSHDSTVLYYSHVLLFSPSRPLQPDLRPSHCQRSLTALPEQQEGGAYGLRAPPRLGRRVPLRLHLAGIVFAELHSRPALLGAGGVQTVGLRGRDVPRHPAEGEGQALHGGDERAVLEPAAGRAAAERVARRLQGGRRRSAADERSAAAHRDAAGL